MEAMHEMRLIRPMNFEELGLLLQTIPGEERSFLAGGTDLIVSWNAGKLRTACLVDLSGMEVMKCIEKSSESIRIGALATFSDLEHNTAVRDYIPALWDAAWHMGSTQIRNMATIGGNLCHMSPAADGAAALLALHAELQLIDRHGKELRTSLEQFFQQRAAGGLKDVLLAYIVVPIQDRTVSAFVKIGTRTSVTISQLILSSCIQLGADDVIQSANFVIGAVGPFGVQDTDTNEWARGKRLDKNLFAVLSERLQNTIEQMIPNRASLFYKRTAITGLTEDLLEMLQNRMEQLV